MIPMLPMIARTAAILRAGGVVLYPTDTLYGLGALASLDAAVERVFRLKGRPADKPLPLLLARPQEAEVLAIVSPLARKLMGRFWPGALTLILPRASAFRSRALAGGDSIALRLPDHPLARALIEAAGGPLTGTSANRAGGPDPVTAQEALSQLGDGVDLVLDAGPCPRGRGSTVLDLTGEEPVLLREGALPTAALAEVLEALVRPCASPSAAITPASP